MNIDACISHHSWIRLGVAIRDDKGNLQLVVVQRMTGTTIPWVAEALSMRFGLQMALMRGWSLVEVETDCLQLYNLLTAPDSNCKDGGMLLEDIK